MADKSASPDGKPVAPDALTVPAAPTATPIPASTAPPTPPLPRRGPGHRGAEVRDTVAEMAAKAHEISLEAGSKMAAAMKDVVNAAAGLTGFVLESARDLVQYMVRRGQMTQEEADKLIRQAEEAQSGRPAVSAAHPPQPPRPQPVPTPLHKPEPQPVVKATAELPPVAAHPPQEARKAPEATVTVEAAADGRGKKATAEKPAKKAETKKAAAKPESKPAAKKAAAKPAAGAKKAAKRK